jgi:outer membrane lipoprotein-sorting protein
VSVLGSRPVLRWLVPSVAAVVVIGGGAAVGTIVAGANPSLPDRSAAQLLVDLQNPRVDGLSGTFVESADLGLPAIAGSVQGPGSGVSALAGLLAGSSTARTWHAGRDRARVALLSAQGETDLIRNGSDVWVWNSGDQKASHSKVPVGLSNRELPDLAGLPPTPQEAADAALAAIGPTTRVETTGAARVAGRDAHELVLSPADAASLIGQVRLAIDAATHIPLRVDVYARNAARPSVRVAFQQVSFTVPDAGEFAFNPPPGTAVVEADILHIVRQTRSALGADPSVVGKAWTSVVKAELPKVDDGRSLDTLIGALPKVSGPWGHGRLFAGTLLSVLVTDDGRVFAGPVTPEKLYSVAVASEVKRP